MKEKTFSLIGNIISSREISENKKIISIKFDIDKNTECRIMQEDGKFVLLVKNLLVSSKTESE
jgi:hypothetical protein